MTLLKKSFLVYVLCVCFLTVLCYLFLVCTLVYHEILASSGETRKPTPFQKIRDSLICPGRIVSDPSRLEQLQIESLTAENQEERQIALARQELRGRAFCSITGLLVALLICWMLPICLSLHAIFAADSHLLSTIPRCDALIFLSAVVHPFLYGEAWVAVPYCMTGVRKTIVIMNSWRK